MLKQRVNNRETNSSLTSTSSSLLIAAHCTTIRRKAAEIDSSELSAILNDLVRELNSIKPSIRTYLNSLNEIVITLNGNFPPKLLEISSHYFCVLVRNAARNLLYQLHTTNRLNHQEIYILRNCTIFMHEIVEKIEDVSKILHWITDGTFLDGLAKCLNNLNKISKANENQHLIKQISRLLNIFCHIQERLPIALHQTLFVRLLQPTIKCLTSLEYVKLFRDLKPNAKSLTEQQKLYLIKCPHFLTSYNGPHIEQAIEQVLAIMLPRYVSILDKHMGTIKEWTRPMMRAIHNLIIPIVYAEGYFSNHTNNKSFQLLMNHLLNILKQPTLIEKISSNSNNLETLIIDATLVVFSVLIYEPDALNYLKQTKPITVFQSLTKTSHETIVLNAYMMLAYIMDENDIKTFFGDLTQLFSMTLTLLEKAIDSRQKTNVHDNLARETIDRNIVQLTETLKVLSHYDQVRNEILQLGKVTFLIDICRKLFGLSKQYLLECLWTLSFNEKIAEKLREDSLFMDLLDNIPKLVNTDNQQNSVRRSASYSSRQNSTIIALSEGTNNGMQRAVDGLLWTLVRESEFREKLLEATKNQTESNATSNNRNHKYDILMSACNADKHMVHKIRKLLANEGYNIWYDRSHNHKYAMETVADAIEHSEFILIFMSDLYERDNCCQAEARFANNSKRYLIPLLLRDNFKPDGILTSIISKNTPIDFTGSDFKAAFERLLRVLKQRQHTKETTDIKSTVVKANNTIPNQPMPSNASERSNILVASSMSPEVIRRLGGNLPSGALSPQQRMPASSNTATRSPTVNATSNIAPVAVVEPRQLNRNPISKLSTSDAISPTTSTPLNQQQQQQQQQVNMQSSSKLTTSSTNTVHMSLPINQQHQIAVNHVQRSPLSYTDQQYHHEQQLMTDKSLLQSTSVSSLSPELLALMDKQQLQAIHYANMKSAGTNTSTSSMYLQQEQPSKQTAVKSTISNSAAKESMTSASRSHSSDPAMNLERKQNQTQMKNGASYLTSTTLFQHQQLIPSNIRPLVNGAAITPPMQVDPNLRTAASSSTSSEESMNSYKQQLQRSLMYPNSMKTPNGAAFSATYNVANYQQQALMHLQPHMVANKTSYASTPAINNTLQQQTLLLSAAQQQQQQRTPPTSNSETTVVNSMPIPSISFQNNYREPPRLPEQYTKRNTSNSTYRTIPIHAWSSKEVLDFLFDSNLHALMPICETMSGKALVRLFRMCQLKPSRLYDQLNEELHFRCNGFTLPMGVYTEFLIEMDGLAGPIPHTMPTIPSLMQIPIERVAYTPNSVENPGTLMRTSSGLAAQSIVASHQPKVATPAETMLATTAIQNTSLPEEADFRPKSSISKPY